MGFTDEEFFYQEQTLLPASEQKHADYLSDMLRLKFLKIWIVGANLDLYKTDAERDWAYIARRDYRYRV